MKIAKTVAFFVAVSFLAGCATHRQYAGGTADESLIEAGGVDSGTTTSSMYRPESPFGTAAPIAIQPAFDPDF